MRFSSCLTEPDVAVRNVVRRLVLMTIACSIASPQLLAEATKPNILLVMSDDQGYWDTGVSGNTKLDTPRMDQLAAEGIRFTRFYAAPVCAPTRAGLMTGRYYLRTGLYNTRFGGDSLGLDEITLAQLLKKTGYRSGIFGKWHLGKYAPYQPQHRGFDQFFGHYHGHIERYDFPDQLVHNGTPVEARGYVTDLFTDAAIEFMGAESGAPFFCYVAYNAPHSPFVLDTSHSGQPQGDKLIEKYLGRGLPLRDARIYAMVERIDHNLGRLLDAVDQRGLRKQTVVIFMSDNGGVSRSYKAGLNGFKSAMYEGGVRVPCFVRWTGRFPAGKAVAAQASHIDLLPTLCELAGVAPPDDRKIDGRSLLPILEQGGGSSPHQYIYHTWDRYTPNPYFRWAISSQRYKLLVQQGTANRSKPAEPAGRLYDLREDPGETRDIAQQHPHIVRRMRAAFLEWFQEVTRGQTYQPVPIPVGHPQENPVEIQPSWATWHGNSVRYTFDGYDWDTIDSWSQVGEYATWDLDVLQAGHYDVRLSYGCSRASVGGTLRLAAAHSSLDFWPQATPAADVFRSQRLGTLALPSGRVKLTAEIVRSNGNEVIRLNRIWLRRRQSSATHVPPEQSEQRNAGPDGPQGSNLP